jgi:hypothetical protein
MAYDAANSTVILFGGEHSGGYLKGTWTWNGTTWTQHHPATSPPPRANASMAYDAATGTVVLFGGDRTGRHFNDTWTWNGTTWTQQHPATSPPVLTSASMAYDAATGTAVLFGGFGGSARPRRVRNQTWTWDGTTWTRQHPAASPSARDAASMVYDAATGTVVLFGGNTNKPNGHLADTWTWDGTTWTQQSPATSPPARDYASMAYDAATGTVVLFGGQSSNVITDLADTWTWDGTTWTQQSPATSPPASDMGVMAYDAATSTAVLLPGGTSETWTWG